MLRVPCQARRSSIDSWPTICCSPSSTCVPFPPALSSSSHELAPKPTSPSSTMTANTCENEMARCGQMPARAVCRRAGAAGTKPELARSAQRSSSCHRERGVTHRRMNIAHPRVDSSYCHHFPTDDARGRGAVRRRELMRRGRWHDRWACARANSKTRRTCDDPVVLELRRSAL